MLLWSTSTILTYSSAVKLAKTILADHRDSLALWDGYARLERQRGKLDDARKVYVTALSLSSDEVKSMSAEGRGEAWVLWKGWVEMEWEAGEWTRVARVLEAAAAGKQGLDGLGQSGASQKPVYLLSRLTARSPLIRQIAS